jgi:hypothetical protein
MLGVACTRVENSRQVTHVLVRISFLFIFLSKSLDASRSYSFSTRPLVCITGGELPVTVNRPDIPICHLTAGFILRSRVLSRLAGTSLKTGGSRRGPDPLAIQSGIYVSTMERSFIKLVHCLLFYRADWIKVRKQHNLNRRATRPVTRVSLPRDSLTATVPRHSHG